MKLKFLKTQKQANNDNGYIVSFYRINNKLLKFFYEARNNTNDSYTVYIFDGNKWNFFLGNEDLQIERKSSYLLTKEEKLQKAEDSTKKALQLTKILLKE